MVSENDSDGQRHAQFSPPDAGVFIRAELSRPSSYVKPMTYGAVAPGLFDAIVADRVPPNPVPPPQHNPPTEKEAA